MELPEPDACYQALLSHDCRFDGRLFVAVTSTGIYCRPVCRVRPPRRENCRFFPSAAAAEAAGFRPCLRCCPEHAPGRAPVDAASMIACAAAEMIESGLQQDLDAAALAMWIGVSERHLRRVFAAEFGVSPAAYLASRRLQLGRRLLRESAMSVLDVALTTGFRSLRTFNVRYRSAYGEAPRSARGARRAVAEATLDLPLAYRPPLDWEAMLAFLGGRAIPGVELVSATGTYRRTVRMTTGASELLGWVEVSKSVRGDALVARISASLARVVPQLTAGLRRLFDLSCDPAQVNTVLGVLAQRRPGLRVPGALDGFEMAVRAIIGQQVSVAAARTLAGRFAARFGSPVDTPWPELSLCFPTPVEIAASSSAAIGELGIFGSRAGAIIGLAAAIAEQGLRLSPRANVADTRASLLSLPGIGPWTADYIAMRALSWPDAFPEGDAGVHRALGVANRARVRAIMSRWEPWRAYAVMHLWNGADWHDDQA